MYSLNLKVNLHLHFFDAERYKHLVISIKVKRNGNI